MSNIMHNEKDKNSMNKVNNDSLSSVSKRYFDKNGIEIKEGDTLRTWGRYDYKVEKIDDNLCIEGSSLSEIATTWCEVVNVC